MIEPIFQPKWMSIMLALQEKETTKTTELYKKTFITYSHINNIIKTAEKKGWIKTWIEGRNRKVQLTKKGQEITQGLKKIKENW